MASRNVPGSVEYGTYLRLDELLSAQAPESGAHGQPAAHDEMLFIITHQAYELWFKQILHELDSVLQVFSGDTLDDRLLATAIHRLGRVRTIQDLLLGQIDVIETMTPLDFLDFRDLLVPASGFQSLQFKQIEIVLGLEFRQRSAQDQDFFRTRLSEAQRQELAAREEAPSLFERTVAWLERMPFAKQGGFDFWHQYGQAVDRMLSSDHRIVMENPSLSENRREQQLRNEQQNRERFDAILNVERYQQLREQGVFRFSHRAFLAALFIHLYRDEPILFAPFQFLVKLLEIDEAMTRWRNRHAMMVHRMLGTRIGTGGSSGQDYLAENARRYRVWNDLFHLSTFLIPRSQLPELPAELRRNLGFHFGHR